MMEANAVLDYRCEDRGDGTSLFYWNWQDVPTDDREPGLDRYYVQVVNLETSIEIIGIYGAEDNATGTDYVVSVPNDVGLYVLVINEADAFRFEMDAVVTCTAEVAVATSAGMDVLPFTGVTDWLLPVAVALIALGASLTRLGSTWRK